jgi:Tetracyclin repressor-like, C-terminal domain
MMAYPLLGQLALKFMGEYQTNPEIFQVYLTQVLVPRFQQFGQMVEQAQAREEIRRDIDWTMVIDLIGGSLYFHWITTRFLLPSSSFSPDEWVEKLIDAVMQGIGTK